MMPNFLGQPCISNNSSESSQAPSDHTTPNVPSALQNELYFVNIYRNITDINFTPVTYVYTVQMQQKENQKNLKVPDLRLDGAPVSDGLQQCRRETS